MPHGLIIAPRQDTGMIKFDKATGKMRRLFKREEADAFASRYAPTLNALNAAVAEHDRDRAQLMSWVELNATLFDHYDREEANAVGAEHTPGLVYMDEVARVLLAGSEKITPALEPLLANLLDVSKLRTADGWALRAMVGAQEGLFSTVETFWQQQFDWYTNPDNKLDKSFDTLKGLLCDETATGVVKAKLGWITQTGVGSSLRITAFLAGAASHLLAQSLARAATTAAASAGQAAQAAASRTTQLLDSAEGRLSAKFSAWAHQQALMLDAVLNKTPPPRPVRARVNLSTAQAVQLLELLSSKGMDFNRTTRNQLALWQRLPHNAQMASVTLDLLTTDVALRDVPAVNAFNEVNVTGARVAPGAGRARLQYPPVPGVPPVIDATPQTLRDLFERAHRYDVMKGWATNFVGRGLPSAVEVISMVAAAPVRGAAAALGAAGAALPSLTAAAGTITRSAVSAPATLSLFGAMLQWHLLEKNEEKLAIWRQRLAETRGLSEDQREALQEAIALAEFGTTDNKAGLAGGVMEAVAIATEKVRFLKYPSGTLSGLAAFAGAAGNFMNAMQNFAKSKANYREGNRALAAAYFGVSALYGAGGAMLVGSGVETLHTLVVHKSLLEGSLRGATNAVRATEAAAGRFVARRLVLLSFTGWGLVLTLGSFVVEALVVYMDRSALEEWMEGCYFGGKPKYRHPGANASEQWDQEFKALDAALKKLSSDAVVAVKDEKEFTQRFPRLTKSDAPKTAATQ